MAPIPERGSRYVETEALLDPPMCINCNLPKPENERWVWVELLTRDNGVVTTLEAWPLCTDCGTASGASLVAYVKFALS